MRGMNETTQPAIAIGADGIDVHRLEEEILASVADKRARGVYDDELVARAERNNILTLQDDEEFMEQYLTCLRQIVPVDINDFPILERRSLFAPASRMLKKVIWKMLKFYTFRLWSQQNQTNALLFSAIELLTRRNSDRIKALESSIQELERRLAKP
jgi:hypothetical protein